MKKNILLIVIILLVTTCEKDNINGPQNGDINYKQEMRDFVKGISQYAKAIDSDFLIIPQNAQEIVTEDAEPDDPLMTDYITAIDGTGIEDLFYGYNNDDELTPGDERDYLIIFCDIFEQNNLEVLTIDYCSTHDKMDSSYAWNHAKGYISFAAPERELNVIPDYPPQPFNVNSDDIATFHDAQNFLYLINPEEFPTKQSFINAVSATNYDLIIMDCFWGDQTFSGSEIAQLKTKQNNGQRLVIAYLSIGEAENYRYYWQENWEDNPPDWLGEENPNWEGNFKVHYWDENWKNIIFGTDSSYLDRILDAGFDGAYLDIIDAYYYFEENH